jgi:transcriptional regulator CtsR
MDNIPELIESYLKQLSPHEKIAYTIAVKNLESSFDIEKSIGFLNYIKETKSKNQHTYSSSS